MRVLLVFPNSKESGIDLSVVPPLGILQVAAALRRAGHQVLFLDADRDGLSIRDLASQIERFSPELIGITLNAITAPYGLEAIERLKAVFPGIPWVAGGPHPSGQGAPLLEECPALDFLVLGEGERTSTELVAMLAMHSGKPELPRALAEIPGLVFRMDEGVKQNSSRVPVEAIDDLPLPALDLAGPLERYPGVFPALSHPSLHLMTSRGCPFSCSFCSNPVWGKKARYASVNRVVENIRLLIRDHGAREIYILDDTFNYPLDRAKRIFREVIAQRLNDRAVLRVCFRADRRLIDEELLELAAGANVWLVFYGVESGSEEIRKSLRKQNSLDDVRRAIEMTHAHGMRTICSFMIGNLGDSADSVRQTISFAKALHPGYYDFPVATPLPGTRFHADASARNLIKKVDPRQYTFQTAVCETGHLRLEEVDDLRARAFRELREDYLSLRHELAKKTTLQGVFGYPEELARTTGELIAARNINYEHQAIDLAPHEVRPGLLRSAFRLGAEDHACLGGGWYGPERDGGDPFRWMARRARFYLPGGSGRVLEIDLHPGSFWRQKPGIELTLEIFGSPGQRTVLWGRARRTVRFLLPPSPAGYPFHICDLVLDQIFRPSDHQEQGTGGAQDHRELGLRVYMVMNVDGGLVRQLVMAQNTLFAHPRVGKWIAGLWGRGQGWWAMIRAWGGLTARWRPRGDRRPRGGAR